VEYRWKSLFHAESSRDPPQARDYCRAVAWFTRKNMKAVPALKSVQTASKTSAVNESAQPDIRRQ
jgi:hypothetical protein